MLESRKRHFAGAVLKGWASADPNAARMQLASLPSANPIRDQAITALIRALAERDLRSAADFVVEAS